eukprot:TRINITY_DN31032_c0_g1_i3.p4 TRINITY_DN31032_c0_g1~~TRINITY_DN31032_c0_g1_i3.p4  ORF type:complete len:116 (+),score=45.72 TRINITY_DN31032_c0_g1_i3:843-1190(+)
MLAHMQDIKNLALDHLEKNNTAKKQDGNYDAAVYAKAPRNIIAGMVKVARISKMWNPKMARVEIRASDQTTAAVVQPHIERALIVYAKAQKKDTQAPKSDIERRIEALLAERGAE